MHAEGFTDGEQAKGKKVVVVGGGKSAVDCAVVAGNHGVESTLLFRSAHWPCARHLAGFVPLGWYAYTRFCLFMLPTHYDLSPGFKLMHKLLAPVKWIWWRTAEQILKFQYGLKGDRVPKYNLEIDVFSGGQILNYDYRDAINKGTVQDRLGSIEKFVEDGVILKDGSKLEADMVVFATGFTKSYDYFDDATIKSLDKQKDGLYLYR